MGSTFNFFIKNLSNFPLVKIGIFFCEIERFTLSSNFSQIFLGHLNLFYWSKSKM